MESMSNIVIELIRIRKAMKINQAELSRRSGISRNMINRIELGLSDCTSNMLEKIAQAIGAKVIIEKGEGTIDPSGIFLVDSTLR